VRQELTFNGQENRPQFEHRQPGAEFVVVFQQLQHGRQAAAAQHGAVGCDGVLDAHVLQRGVGRVFWPQARFAFGRGLPVGDCILQAGAHEDVPHALFHVQAGVAHLGGQLGGKTGSGQAVVAVNAADFLDEVGFANNAFADIQARGRGLREQLSLLNPAAKAKAGEDIRGFFQRNGGAERGNDFPFAQAHQRVHLQAGVGVQNAVHGFPASPLGHAPQAQAQGVFRQSGVNSAAEAPAGFAGNPHLADRLADVDEIPGGSFQQDARTAGVDARFAAAHHACQRKRTSAVAYQFHALVQCERIAVQGGQLLARGSGARDHGGFAAAGALNEQVVIKSVQGFARVQHGVVGGVHQRVYRAHARQA